jgi:hypothetical protein
MANTSFAPSLPQFEAWQALEDKTTQWVAYGGAAGGGKSFLGCYWKIYRRMAYPGTRGVICRETKISLRESTIITYNKVLGLCGLKSGIDYRFNGTYLTYEFANGSKEIFRDLEYLPSDPDYQRLGSLEVTDAWIEEDFATIPEKAADVLKTRIRWMLHDYNLVPKLLLTTNPGYHWIRTRFIKDAENNPVVLRANEKFISAKVTDNPDAAFVEIYKASLEDMRSQYDRARLLDGDWDAIEKTGGEFYHSFDFLTHVGDYRGLYKNDTVLHVSFDFNTLPYVSCTLWQADGKTVTQIREICLPPPQNNTPDTARKLAELFNQHKGEIYIYGDPAGRHKDTRDERGRNDYSIILETLRAKGFRVSEKVDSKAPSVNVRGLFINEIFKANYSGIRIQIDNSCMNTIKDYQQVQKDRNGNKDKKRITDPRTKVSYEPIGHTSDANDYFLCRFFLNEYIAFQAKQTDVQTAPRNARTHQV